MVKIHSINSVHQLFTHDFSKIISCGKDVFYSIKNNTKINWRQVLSKQCVQCYQELRPPDLNAKSSDHVPCLIADDTDIVKRGKCMEMIGKIFSHVRGKYPLGYKTLVLSYWTGKTVLHVDFTTHIEVRKDGMQGMTKKEIKNRYSKIRKAGSHGAVRIQECVDKKTTALIKMLKRSLQTPLSAKYLLADSWFFNSELVQYISTTTLHLITRPKLNNWKYGVNRKEYTIKELIRKYRNHKLRKYSRKLNMYTVTLEVTFKGEQIKLYLYKPKKRGSSWQVLVSTHRSLTAIKAYEIYKNRWAIEVSFKELKQHLQFGKCQSRDFVGQIADQTICLLTYNLLSTYKCKNEHETLGALFSQIKQHCISPTIMQKFWNTINKVINKISTAIQIDAEKLLEIICENPNLLNIFNLNNLELTTET
jgi:hypothetical protein